jgi:hypothetical protein
VQTEDEVTLGQLWYGRSVDRHCQIVCKTPVSTTWALARFVIGQGCLCKVVLLNPKIIKRRINYYSSNTYRRGGDFDAELLRNLNSNVMELNYS